MEISSTFYVHLIKFTMIMSRAARESSLGHMSSAGRRLSMADLESLQEKDDITNLGLPSKDLFIIFLKKNSSTAYINYAEDIQYNENLIDERITESREMSLLYIDIYRENLR